MIDGHADAIVHRKQMRNVRQYKKLVLSSKAMLDRYDHNTTKSYHRRRKVPAHLLTPILQRNENVTENSEESYLPDWSPSSNKEEDLEISHLERLADNDYELQIKEKFKALPEKSNKRVYTRKDGRTRKSHGFSSLPSLTLYQN